MHGGDDGVRNEHHGLLDHAPQPRLRRDQVPLEAVRLPAHLHSTHPPRWQLQVVLHSETDSQARVYHDQRIPVRQFIGCCSRLQVRLRMTS